MSRWVLLGICVLFGTYLVLQLWPRFASWRRRRGSAARGAAGPARRDAAGEVAAARARAAAAATPSARAGALADAGDAAARAGRWTSALGLFLRALRADPHAVGIAPRLVDGVGDARPRDVESILWRRLGALPEDDEHLAAAADLATALATLYQTRFRDRSRATVMRRHAARLRAR